MNLIKMNKNDILSKDQYAKSKWIWSQLNMHLLYVVSTLQYKATLAGLFVNINYQALRSWMESKAIFFSLVGVNSMVIAIIRFTK